MRNPGECWRSTIPAAVPSLKGNHNLAVTEETDTPLSLRAINILQSQRFMTSWWMPLWLSTVKSLPRIAVYFCSTPQLCCTRCDMGQKVPCSGQKEHFCFFVHKYYIFITIFAVQSKPKNAYSLCSYFQIKFQLYSFFSCLCIILLNQELSNKTRKKETLFVLHFSTLCRTSRT